MKNLSLFRTLMIFLLLRTFTAGPINGRPFDCWLFSINRIFKLTTISGDLSGAHSEMNFSLSELKVYFNVKGYNVFCLVWSNRFSFFLKFVQWRLFALLLVFQALAVMTTERGYVADAFHFRISKWNWYGISSWSQIRNGIRWLCWRLFACLGRPYGYRGRPEPVGNPYGNSNKRPAHSDEEYQYGPDEIPYIYYS